MLSMCRDLNLFEISLQRKGWGEEGKESRRCKEVTSVGK